MVYGSIAKGTATLRSDLDVLITHVDDSHPVAMIKELREIFADVEDHTHVTVESNIWPSSSLTSGNHTIDAQFYDHLRTVGLRWKIGDPLAGMKLGKEGYGEVFRRYYLHKVRGFTTALSDTSLELDYKKLQRALELPSALGRKALSTLHHYGHDIPVTPGELSKKDVLGWCMSLGLLERPDIRRPWQELLALDAGYDEALIDAVSGYTSVDTYEQAVAHLYEPAISAALVVASNFGVFVMGAVERASK
jgi:hypothetical protein